MDITIVRTSVTRADLNEIAKQQFGDMVKAVVDVEQDIMAIGGELHSDEEAVLLEHGALHKNLWGINLYPERSSSEWIELDSMINVRPSGGTVLDTWSAQRPVMPSRQSSIVWYRTSCSPWHPLTIN